jgi:hypothetical protein
MFSHVKRTLRARGFRVRGRWREQALRWWQPVNTLAGSGAVPPVHPGQPASGPHGGNRNIRWFDGEHPVITLQLTPETPELLPT